ncbi:MAG: VOC family protein [Planctomycetes bacterium]|nr:VOC family protein [Planctomycetota bacterium]
MVQNPPDGMPRITPSLAYADPAAAIDWLTRVFGFTARIVIPGEDGGVVHAELCYADGVVMLGPAGAVPGFDSPRHLGGGSGGLYVYVDDVDAHYERVKAAGAEVLGEPVTQFYGDRNYAVRDLEGHRWSFGQHVEDVDFSAFEPQQEG